MNEQEQWRPVTLPEFSALYLVSNFGRVQKQSTGRILQGTPTQRGALQIKLHLPTGQTKNVIVSHLVMGTFREDPAGRSVGYLDGNRRHVWLENLFFHNPKKDTSTPDKSAKLQLKPKEAAAQIWAKHLPHTSLFLTTFKKALEACQ